VKQKFRGWSAVAERLNQYANDADGRFNEGQRASLRAMAERISENGLVLADEVGMGKTRIAVALARGVIEAGGRVAILVPPGLGYQWVDELHHGQIEEAPQVLRSLRAYLSAWASDQEPDPWFAKPVVLLSHAFANWRLGGRSEPWRWALLPTLYAMWRKKTTDRFPRGFHGEVRLSDTWVQTAAESICDNIPIRPGHSAYNRMQGLIETTPWPGALDPGEYARDEHLRPWLEGAVGLGLGVFDLVIIDEAHKSRGTDSGLFRLLDSIILQSKEARRLAMTATPVELNARQWKQTLERISVDEQSLTGITSSIEDYAAAVTRVRKSWRGSDEARQSYKQTAQVFHKALSPYLLRRDKREDDAVRKFVDYTNEGADAYRSEREISIETQHLAPAWRQAVCAAESLSLVTHNADDPKAKRLRLTLGSGHGIAAVIDQVQRDEEADRRQEEEDQDNEQHPGQILDLGSKGAEGKRTDVKREQRTQWWQNVLKQAFAGQVNGLFEHPSILSAVEAIEQYTSKGEKVLVFGRFTRPLRALNDLLNAREMLRSLVEARSWPQSKIHRSREVDEWPAVEAAHRQLNCPIPLSEVEERLERQYVLLERRREHLRDNLFEWIAAGIDDKSSDLRALLTSAEKAPGTETRNLMARALDDLLEGAPNPTPGQCARAFEDLISALRDRDEGDVDSDGGLDDAEAGELWLNLEARLREEYGTQRGSFARLMYGETKLPTRRMLQLAFNRVNSYPRVLIAQSMVGREGLNLHQACRVVVLLHPEWNPGVVEQQIGRVDRVGSHWSRMLDDAIAAGTARDEVKRIEICPVIFQDTYDEHHWKVLRERWDDLRAQLHGIVVPQRFRSAAESFEYRLAKELDEAGPNFSPLKGNMNN
jgi:superfamily II DNA or RNA helicase